MNASQLLTHLTNRQVDTLFELARKIPAEKLDWSPSDKTRSALNQLQEVATSLTVFMPGMVTRKVTWDNEKFANWMAERSKITTLEELERLTRESTQKLVELIVSTPEADLDEKVEMPFPGEFKVADILAYHYWNMSYHEGQINTILQMLGGPE